LQRLAGSEKKTGRYVALSIRVACPVRLCMRVWREECTTRADLMNCCTQTGTFTDEDGNTFVTYTAYESVAVKCVFPVTIITCSA